MTQGGKRDILMKPACSDKGCELFLFLELFLWMLRITVLVGGWHFQFDQRFLRRNHMRGPARDTKMNSTGTCPQGSQCVCVCMCVIRDKKKIATRKATID